MRRVFQLAACSVLGAIVTVGCKTERPPAASTTPRDEHSAHSTDDTAQRFVFPPQSSPFLAGSVAMDTKTGTLCKTYPWPDTQSLPSGLRLCSEASGLTVESLAGATTAYLGFTYTFNGSKWIKGSKARSYNPKTQNMDPWSADQYDPLALFSKEEKRKKVLSVSQIQAVATKFGVSYQEALQDAQDQGYQVPK